MDLPSSMVMARAISSARRSRTARALNSRAPLYRAGVAAQPGRIMRGAELEAPGLLRAVGGIVESVGLTGARISPLAFDVALVGLDRWSCHVRVGELRPRAGGTGAPPVKKHERVVRLYRRPPAHRPLWARVGRAPLAVARGKSYVLSVPPHAWRDTSRATLRSVSDPDNQ